jgi:hypothetical protein
MTSIEFGEPAGSTPCGQEKTTPRSGPVLHSVVAPLQIPLYGDGVQFQCSHDFPKLTPLGLQSLWKLAKLVFGLAREDGFLYLSV